MLAWRICPRAYADDAFSGRGASREGGRWNPAGCAVVYTSASLSLAALEFFANLDTPDLALPLVAITADIPGSIGIVSIEPAGLPEDWRAYPTLQALEQIGAEWIDGAKSAVLSVPSALIPRERNYLLNPAHPDFRKIAIGKPEPFSLNHRKWKRRR